MALIKNEDISINLTGYLEIFNSQKLISFELTEPEYIDLSNLTKSYREERKKSSFDKETWLKSLNENGSLDNDNVFYVLGFLMLIWKPTTHISAEKVKEYIIVTITKRETIQ